VTDKSFLHVPTKSALSQIPEQKHTSTIFWNVERVGTFNDSHILRGVPDGVTNIFSMASLSSLYFWMGDAASRTIAS